MKRGVKPFVYLFFPPHNTLDRRRPLAILFLTQEVDPMEGLPITPGIRKKLMEAGIHGNRISNWKAGLARPNKHVAPTVARIMKMSVRRVMGIPREELQPSNCA